MSNLIPILKKLNDIEDERLIRWCTPSILSSVERVNDIYTSDISISYHEFGNPSMRTGVFGDAMQLAAKTFGADLTLFSVNGSSGSNFMVLRALKRQLGKVHVLAQRNIHKSISVAADDYQISISFLPPTFDEFSEAFIPNSIEEIIKSLKENPSINVLLLTLPTYEGLGIDLPSLVRKVRKLNPKVIIYIDEAWGSHISFSNELPIGAMEAGADICVQSLHKQASALQQTGAIHMKGKRINKTILLDSYKALMTTSPSFHLLASIDAARAMFEEKGEQILKELISLVSQMNKSLSEIRGIECLDLGWFTSNYKHINSLDKTKLVVNTLGTGFSAGFIAKELEEKYKVILEKNSFNNLLLLGTFQSGKREVEESISAVKKILKGKVRKSSKDLGISFPKRIEKKLDRYQVRDMKSCFVDLRDSKGCICAESIVPYPPGIPLVDKGEIIQDEHIEIMSKIIDQGEKMKLIMEDYQLKKIKVIK